MITLSSPPASNSSSKCFEFRAEAGTPEDFSGTPEDFCATPLQVFSLHCISEQVCLHALEILPDAFGVLAIQCLLAWRWDKSSLNLRLRYQVPRFGGVAFSEFMPFSRLHNLVRHICFSFLKVEGFSAPFPQLQGQQCSMTFSPLPPSN